MVALATQLIGQKASDEWRPEKYRNHDVDAVRELVKEKAKGHVVLTAEEPEAVPRGTVIDLMEALRKSISAANPAAAKLAEKRARPAARRKRRLDVKRPTFDPRSRKYRSGQHLSAGFRDRHRRWWVNTPLFLGGR